MNLSIPCKLLPDEYLILSQAYSNVPDDQKAGFLQRATGGKPIVVEYNAQKAAAFEQQTGRRTAQTVGGEDGVVAEFTASKLLPATINGDLNVPPSVDRLDNITVRGKTTVKPSNLVDGNFKEASLRTVGNRFNTQSFDAYNAHRLSGFAGNVQRDAHFDRCPSLTNFEGRTTDLEIGRSTPVQRIDGVVSGQLITMDGASMTQPNNRNSGQQTSNLSPAAALVNDVLGGGGQNVTQIARNVPQQNYGGRGHGQNVFAEIENASPAIALAAKSVRGLINNSRGVSGVHR